MRLIQNTNIVIKAGAVPDRNELYESINQLIYFMSSGLKMKKTEEENI